MVNAAGASRRASGSSSSPIRRSWAAAATARVKSTRRSPISRRSARIVLKSVTRLPRLGNPTPRLVHTPAGMLNAIGLQNPGLDWYLAHEVHKYAERPCKIVGSVAGFSVDDYAYVCERLAARDEIAAVELNVSCPNVASEGETFGCDPELDREGRAARAVDHRQAADREALAERHRHYRRRARGGSRRRRRARGDQHGARNGDRRRNVAAASRQRHGRSLGPGDPADRRARRLRSCAGSKDSDRRSRRHRESHRRARSSSWRARRRSRSERRTSPIRAFPSASSPSCERISRRAISRRSTRSSERRTWDLQRRINTKETKDDAECSWPS